MTTRRNPHYAESVRIAQYLADHGRSASGQDIDTLIKLTLGQFASTADPDWIRDKVLHDWVTAVSGASRYAAQQASAAAQSHAYAASPIARVVGARVAGAYFGGQTPVDWLTHVREIAWRLDDFPVELVYGDSPADLEAWEGWLSEFWRDNDNGAYMSTAFVRDVLAMQPGDEVDVTESAFVHSTLRRLRDASGIGTAAGGFGEDLAFINRVRARMAMRPLDPAAAGWSHDDIRLEADRLRREGNPRSQCLAW